MYRTTTTAKQRTTPTTTTTTLPTYYNNHHHQNSQQSILFVIGDDHRPAPTGLPSPISNSSLFRFPLPHGPGIGRQNPFSSLAANNVWCRWWLRPASAGNSGNDVKVSTSISTSSLPCIRPPHIVHYGPFSSLRYPMHWLLHNSSHFSLATRCLTLSVVYQGRKRPITLPSATPITRVYSCSPGPFSQVALPRSRRVPVPDLRPEMDPDLPQELRPRLQISWARGSSRSSSLFAPCTEATQAVRFGAFTRSPHLGLSLHGRAPLRVRQVPATMKLLGAGRCMTTDHFGPLAPMGVGRSAF